MVCGFSVDAHVRVCPSGSERTASSSSLTETSPKVTFTEVVELTSKVEPTASPDGSKNGRSDSARLLVLLGEVAWGIR